MYELAGESDEELYDRVVSGRVADEVLAEYLRRCHASPAAIYGQFKGINRYADDHPDHLADHASTLAYMLDQTEDRAERYHLVDAVGTLVEHDADIYPVVREPLTDQVTRRERVPGWESNYDRAMAIAVHREAAEQGYELEPKVVEATNGLLSIVDSNGTIECVALFEEAAKQDTRRREAVGVLGFLANGGRDVARRCSTEALARLAVDTDAGLYRPREIASRIEGNGSLDGVSDDLVDEAVEELRGREAAEDAPADLFDVRDPLVTSYGTLWQRVKSLVSR